MNEAKIEKLLRQWTVLLDTGEPISKDKAEEIPGGLGGRIKRTTGQPIIFDIQTYNNQVSIQTSLCQELPQWSNIIRSKPEEIMDGYPWTRNDFIELYFNHFRLVIEKLWKIIDKQTAM